ncbi:MAG: alpha-amylase [Chloroflexi bacterium]|nr:alpha-amylase [Chloroflexota bacterium]
MTQLQQIPLHVQSAAQSGWKANPVIYEINTWVWLTHLSRKYERIVTLGDVPENELAELAAWRFDALWLMGVWHRGHATRMSALNYLHEYRHALPDISDADVCGSAYAIRDYRVEEQLGGPDGLARFRERLREYGIRLILDFAPNHVATDHRWIDEHPEYFICGEPGDLNAYPESFFSASKADGGELAIAHGRDPYFPAWIDTAQLNVFHAGLRRAIIDTLIEIGSQCDGLRCDMAMLTTNAVFSQTWGERAGVNPAQEFWLEIIPAAREVHPQMLFMAEVYWDLEHELQLQGFDYTYDKRLYDRIVNGDVGEVKSSLRAAPNFLRSSLRFIENHDEPRAMETLGEDRQRAAAALICTLPGASLLHQGQLEGKRIKLPVQINRAADEPARPMLKRFYRRLLHEVSRSIYHDGSWRMIEAEPIHSDDFTYQNLIVYTWSDAGDKRLIVINLSGGWARATVALDDWQQSVDVELRLMDILSESFTRQSAGPLLDRGLQLEVPPFGAHIFRFEQGAG